MDPDACLKEIHEQLFHEGGDYGRALELIEALAEWIAGGGFEPKETMMTEWDDVLVGAYWFCVDYHDGQWSDEYRLQCVISKVYEPGSMCSGPEPDSGEEMVYMALGEM